MRLTYCRTAHKLQSAKGITTIPFTTTTTRASQVAQENRKEGREERLQVVN
jgi:hypothetical protein